MVDNVLLHEKPVQKKAMERANYLEEESSQFETVKINQVEEVEEQRNCCCNVILSSDKQVIMKIVTSAQVMYYFTSA